MAEAVLNSLYVFLAIFAVILLIYMPHIIATADGYKRGKHYTSKKKFRIALIIPARNESAIIRGLLESIAAQSYDREYFDTHIVVADAGDPTVCIAKDYPCTYVHVVTEQKCKGDALDGVLRELLCGDVQYDAYSIVDADNLLDRDYLLEMNNALASDRQIIIGKKMIKNWETKDPASRTLWSNCSALSYIIVDQLGNAYRTRHGLPCTACGTGLTVRDDVIREAGGWKYKTFTEDYELTADAVLNGYTSMYCEYAKTYTEEATSHSVCYRRRCRWIQGVMQVTRKYTKPILRSTFASGRVKSENFEYLFSLFPVLLYFVLTVIFDLIWLSQSIYAFANSLDGGWLGLALILSSFALIYLILLIMTLLCLTVDRDVIRMNKREWIAVLFFNPIFLCEYLPMFVRAMRLGDNGEWKKVERLQK